MNMLNSIILEGDVCSVNKAGIENRLLEFNIQVVRQYKDKDGVMVTEAPAFTIATRGTMADFAAPKVHDGRGVRVVGRLIESEGKVKIFAEHIEFKPEKKNKNNSKKEA